MGKRMIPACLILCIVLACCQGRAESVTEFGTVKADLQAEYIDMGSEQITDWTKFYEFLSGFPNLRKADLFATEIDRERIEEMTGMFPHITFGMTMRIQEHVLRTDATAFSTLHTPESPHHTESDLSPVRFCTNLYALDLGHNLLTSLDFLYDLPELRVLIVSMNTLTDITPVGSLQHLEYLEMFNNSVSDVSCLAGLSCLTDLNLVMNDIESLDKIREAVNLKRLWMSHYNKKLPVRQIRETAAEIRAAFPGCEVDDVSTGVGGTWRTHPHYEVIRRIFNTGYYEPFEDSPAENRPRSE